MPANNIDEYIANHQGVAKDRLVQMRQIIAEVMPDAKQAISWGMPVFKIGKHNAFNFAAFKNHVSLFPSNEAIEHFAEKLKPYKTSKGTIQFQHDEPLPIELIKEIAVWRKQYMDDILLT